MTKKIAALLLALCMLICLSACNNEETSSDISSDVSQTQTTDSQTEESSEANTTTDTSTQTSENTDKGEISSTPQSSTSKPTSTTNSNTSSTSKPTESSNPSSTTSKPTENSKPTTSSTPSTSTPTTSNKTEYISSTVNDIVISNGNNIYTEYSIKFDTKGKCKISSYSYKAVNKNSATQSEIAKINHSLAMGANSKYYYNNAFLWSWGTYGIGADLFPDGPTTFEEFFTKSDRASGFVYGDYCIIPTFILDIEPEFYQESEYTYSYNTTTKTATIDGNSNISSVVVDGDKSKITIANKTYDKTNNSFNAYLNK